MKKSKVVKMEIELSEKHIANLCRCVGSATPSTDLAARAVACAETIERGTPGPWYVVFTDDDSCANAVYVSTAPHDQSHDDGNLIEGTGIEKDVVAITLVQYPRLADHESQLWDENAQAIVTAHNDAPALLRELAATLEGGKEPLNHSSDESEPGIDRKSRDDSGQKAGPIALPTEGS